MLVDDSGGLFGAVIDSMWSVVWSYRIAYVRGT